MNIPLLYMLASYGLCFGLISGKIKVAAVLRQVAFFDEMFQCSYCTGFHCGWMVWLLHGCVEGFATMWVAEFLVWAFASSAFCYMTDVVVQWFESKE